MRKPVEFDLSIGKKKPYSSKGALCPFCSPERLTDILERRGDMLWLMNKYPVFHGAWPTLIVESARHDGDLSNYPAEELHEVIAFGLEKWRETAARPEFKSVIFFRNFGPQSGGSQRHPHSQIIGFYNHDAQEHIYPENFLGAPVFEDENCYVNLSDYPICSVAEFNLGLKKAGRVETFADALQKLARFVLTDFSIPCDSYNLFFYYIKNRIRAKIFPRYIASPLYMGYRLTQVVDGESKERILETLRSEKYFGG